MIKMNASQLIAKKGIVHAKNILKGTEDIGNQGWYFYWCNECGHGGSSEFMLTNHYDRDYIACPKCYKENLNTDDGIEEHLKEYIKAYEYIQTQGGIEMVKAIEKSNRISGYIDVANNLLLAIKLFEEIEASK